MAGEVGTRLMAALPTVKGTEQSRDDGLTLCSDAFSEGNAPREQWGYQNV